MEAALKEVFNVHRNVVRELRARIQKTEDEKDEIEKRLEKKCFQLQCEVQSLQKEKQFLLTTLTAQSLTGPQTFENGTVTSDTSFNTSHSVLEMQVKAFGQMLSALVNHQEHFLVDNSLDKDNTDNSKSPAQVQKNSINRGESQQSSPLHDNSIESDGINMHSASTQPYAPSHKNPLDRAMSKKDTDKVQFLMVKQRDGAPSRNVLASDENTPTNGDQKSTCISHNADKKNLQRRLEDSGWNYNLASHLTCDSDASQTVHLEIKKNGVTENGGEINILAESVKPISSNLTTNKMSSASSKLRLTRDSSKRQRDPKNIPDSKRCKMSSVNSNVLQEKTPQPTICSSAPEILDNTSDTAKQTGFERKIVTHTKSIPLMLSEKELKRKELPFDSNKRKIIVSSSDLVSQRFKPATAGDATTATDCHITIIPETVPVDVDSADTNVSKIHDVQSEYVLEGKEVSKTDEGSSCRFTKSDSVHPSKQVDGTTDSIVFSHSHLLPQSNIISQEPRAVEQKISLDVISQEPRPDERDSPVFDGRKPLVDDSPALFDDADCEDKKSSFPTVCSNLVANGMDPKCILHTHSPSTPRKSPGSPLLLRSPLFNIQNYQNSARFPRPTESVSGSSPSQFTFDHRRLTLGLSKGKKVSKENKSLFEQHCSGNKRSSRNLFCGSADDTIDPEFQDSTSTCAADQKNKMGNANFSRQEEPLNASLDPNVHLTQFLEDVDCHDVTLEPSLHQSLLKDVTQDNCTNKTPHCSILRTTAEHHNSDLLVTETASQDLNDSFDVVPRKSKWPDYPYKEVVRNKDQRRQMKGFTCQECNKYYRSIGLSEKEIAVKATHCSRHRAYYNPPRTPEHFWSIGFPDSQECVERGYQK